LGRTTPGTATMTRMDIHAGIFFERAATFEAMAERVGVIMQEQADEGNMVTSLSHAIDPEDPKGPYQFIVIATPAVPPTVSV
jgi:hypothetical protein